jgi:excisionase family DNA binding protein
MYGENRENYILTIEEACEQLRIGKSGLYQLIRTKQLKAFKIGRNWKIPLSSIFEYINDQCSNK